VADAGVVRVVLLDADNGTEVASMQMPAGQLPASLQPEVIGPEHVRQYLSRHDAWAD
jgi:hypothetical protein